MSQVYTSQGSKSTPFLPFFTFLGNLLLYFVNNKVYNLSESEASAMDFIEKLEYLMKSKGIENLNELSTKSKIPYTTLKGFYTRGTEKIQRTTLNKLVDFFGCTLDYLACDDVVDPSKHFAPEEEYKELYKIERALRNAGFLDKNGTLSDTKLNNMIDVLVANKKFIMNNQEDNK